MKSPWISNIRAALEVDDTKGGGCFADDSATHLGCDIAIDDECFNQPVGNIL